MKNREFSCSKVKNREHLHPADRLIIIPKGGDRDSLLPSSYRPISLTSIVSKCLESLVGNRCEHLLEGKLDPRQSGFTPGRNVEENISLLVDAASGVQKLYDGYGAIILFDISGAFDNVDHQILVDRLVAVLPVPYVKWLANYLSDRNVSLSLGLDSGSRSCTKGVPQGSSHLAVSWVAIQNMVPTAPDACTRSRKIQPC